MQAVPDDDLYAFEPVRVTKGNGDREALIFARYRAWGYLVIAGLAALALGYALGLPPNGYLLLVVWAGVGVVAALRVIDHNRAPLDLLMAVLADLTDWRKR